MRASKAMGSVAHAMIMDGKRTVTKLHWRAKKASLTAKTLIADAGAFTVGAFSKTMAVCVTMRAPTATDSVAHAPTMDGV